MARVACRLRPAVLLLLTVLSPTGAAAAADAFAVGIAPSDDPSLPRPVARDQRLTPDQVYDMTRRAVDLIGGMGSIVADTARTVVIKPNISIPKASGTGVVTDARVVRAVALLVHEAAPGARILIAEGPGGWISPALADCSLVTAAIGDYRGDLVQDGFEIAGHRQTVAELRALGVDIDVHDLNFDPAYEMQVPGGGLVRDVHEIASAIVDADVWINVPVAKTHGAKITCCMKNHFGLYPGTVYGWNKARGTATHESIPHWPRTMDETWVDLVLVSQVDLNVVDMIQGTEGGAFEGKPKRSNLVVAGRDPIATDLVVARLMGFNPDDFEFADLGAQKGIGPGSIDRVTVRGADPAALRSRFAKAGSDYDGDWAEHAQYGMGPRRWILLGPLEPDHAFTAAQLRDLAPVPGQDGWSGVVWFGDDKIDLDAQFDDPVQKVVYAYTRFTMARSDSVRFWIGSDEGLTVWLDGAPLYRHEGRRRHLLGNDKVPGYVPAGEHVLLVRAEQGRGRFDFSINVCEPIDDLRFSGNRYPGVRYHQAGGGPARVDARVAARQSWEPWRVGGIEQSFEVDEDPVVGFRAAPDSLLLGATPAPSTALLDVIATQIPTVATWPADDTVSPVFLSQLPLTMAFMGFGKEDWQPEQRLQLARLLGWAGVDYWVSTANGRDESSKAIGGWLAQGRIPLTGYNDGWEQIDGYRKAGHGAVIHSLRPDTTAWHEFGDGTWGRLPGRDWLEMPVLVVRAAGALLAADAWVDSAAMAALEFARRERAEYVEDWGTRGCPAGLAGWDAFVTEWERLPWTPAWSRTPEVREMLTDMGRGYYARIAQEQRLAGSYFTQAAQGAPAGERRDRLAAAGAAYAETAEALQAIHDGLPKGEGTEASPEAAALQDSIGRLQPLARRARTAERAALTALADLLGAGPLPPAAEDPLLRRADGRRLFSWSAGLSKGVYDLRLQGRDLTRSVLRGRDTEDEASRVEAAARHEAGWQVAIERQRGAGLYHVAQQPARDNDWTAVIRVDDEWTRFDNATELTIWEVPAP